MSETTTDRNDAGTTAERELSERHRLLADDQRRTVLAVLSERADAIAVDELASAVARRSDDPATARTVAARLHHVHLPVLDEAGVVDYDRAAARVEPHRAVRDLGV